VFESILHRLGVGVGQGILGDQRLLRPSRGVVGCRKGANLSQQ
jgi:hypothetical protein